MGADQSAFRRNNNKMSTSALSSSEMTDLASSPGQTDNYSGSEEDRGKSRLQRTQSEQKIQVLQQEQRSSRRSTVTSTQSSPGMGTLVVVNAADKSKYPGSYKDDPLYARVQEIPLFTTVMHNVDKTAWFPVSSGNKGLEEIQSKLDVQPVIRIAHLCEYRLKRNASDLAREQNKLSRQIRETDHTLCMSMKIMTERQRKFAKYAESFNKINEFSDMLSKCQTMLNECKAVIHLLEDMLPPEDKLNETFSWSSVACAEEL